MQVPDLASTLPMLLPLLSSHLGGPVVPGLLCTISASPGQAPNLMSPGCGSMVRFPRCRVHSVASNRVSSKMHVAARLSEVRLSEGTTDLAMEKEKRRRSVDWSASMMASERLTKEGAKGFSVEEMV